ncbi:MAG: TIM barrel protein [Roseibacillus sp.]
MDRRQFVTAAGTTLALAGAGRGIAQEAVAEATASGGAEPFKVLFAPGARHFGGGKTLEGYLDAIKKAYDFGFRAWEDNWLVRRAAGEQEKIGELLREKKMTMGVSVVTTGGGARFYETSAEEEKNILADYSKAVELAKLVGHKWFTLVPGTRDVSQPREEQIKGCVELMQKCCDIFEEADLIAVVEPLSHDMAKKPVLLETFKEGFDFCKLVNRPSCKLLADYYHQQQVGGDLIKNTDECWEEIAYVQYGDVPGRKQPGTGEINYANVTKHLQKKGYTGVIGLEHGIEGTPEDLVKSYREIDAVL